jgi:hypothetical protein
MTRDAWNHTMTYRDDLAALTARHDALSSEVAHKTRELDATTRLLDEAKARLRLPVLDNIRVAAPCSAEWSSMTGDERARHCGACDKTVFNLSGMSRDEAEALIVEKEGDLCVRYFQRKDGTILTKDCRVGVRRRRKLKVIAAGAAALVAGGALIAAFRGDDEESIVMGTPEATEVEMGKVAIEPIDEPVEEVKGEVVREVRGRAVIEPVEQPKAHRGDPLAE